MAKPKINKPRLLLVVRSPAFLLFLIILVNTFVFFPSFFYKISDDQINVLLLHPQTLSVASVLYKLWGYNFIGWQVTYCVWYLSLLLLLYRILLWSKEFLPAKIQKYLPVVLTFILLMCTLLGIRTFGHNFSRMRQEVPASLYIVRLQNFVNRHKKEPDFSFKIIYSDTDTATTITLADKTSKKSAKGPAAYFLFRKYLKASIPKYYVVYTKEEGLLAFISEEQSKRYLRYREWNRTHSGN